MNFLPSAMYAETYNYTYYIACVCVCALCDNSAQPTPQLSIAGAIIICFARQPERRVACYERTPASILYKRGVCVHHLLPRTSKRLSSFLKVSSNERAHSLRCIINYRALAYIEHGWKVPKSGRRRPHKILSDAWNFQHCRGMNCWSLRDVF